MMVRDATREDMLAWWGEVPATMRAIVVEHAGQVLGVAGIARMNDHMQAFSAFKEELRAHRFTMAKAALRYMQMLNETKIPVLAIQSRDEPEAPDLLEKLGFTKQGEGRMWRHG